MTSYTRRDFASSLGLVAGTLIASPTLAETEISPSQTEGPFYPVHSQADLDADLTRVDGHAEEATGDRILVRGNVFNTRGEALSGAIVDVWQANHFGRYDHPKDPNPAKLDEHFQGWAVLKTGSDGGFGYKTIMPAPYPLGSGEAAPVRCRHIHYKVSHPAHTELTTQMYFEGDALIEEDIIMSRVPKEQQALLIAARRIDEDTGLPLYQFKLVLG